MDDRIKFFQEAPQDRQAHPNSLVFAVDDSCSISIRGLAIVTIGSSGHLELSVR